MIMGVFNFFDLKYAADRLKLNKWFSRPRHTFRKYHNPEIKEYPDILVSPCESRLQSVKHISPSGLVEDKSLWGRKRYLTVGELVKHHDVAERYLGGFYAKMYLSPLDLHYVIFPCNGEVVGSLHSPGSALPVIFYRSADIKNERLTTEYKTRFGFNMLIAMIGSFAVNAIERNYQVGESYSQGDILGRFLIGSTVLLIFPPDSAEMLIKVGKKVKLYQPLIKPI